MSAQDPQPPLRVGGDAPVEYYFAVPRRGRVHLRLITPEQRTLWDGDADTGLSPMHDRDELLERAVDALIQQLPAARRASLISHPDPPPQ